MTPYFFITLFITFAIIHVSKAIFYTTSRENDFPRIGKRVDLYQTENLPSDQIGFEPRKYLSYNRIRISDRPVVPSPSHQDEKISLLSRRRQMPKLSKSVLFKLLDRRGDRYFPEDEVMEPWE